MTYMLEEIREQPEVIERIIKFGHADVDALCKSIKQRNIEHILIVARGTSDNAGTYAKYIIEIECGMVVSSAAPSVYTLYKAKPDLTRWLMLGISQSGESTDVNEVMRHAKEAGALTAAIANVENSTLMNMVDHPLPCHAGEEKSVAATKSYLATLAVIYMLAGGIAGRSGMADELMKAADAIEKVLTTEQAVASCVERYRYIEECMVVARGINQATAQEAAIKMSETSYVVAKPYSGADLLHGPIAAVDHGFPVFLYAPPGRAFDSVVEISEKLKALEAEQIIIAGDENILRNAVTKIKIPVEVDEMISPLVYITAGQLFANFLSVSRGNDPDNPRGLCKVTRTL